MVTKVYRYQLASGVWDDFLQLQKKADGIYSKHLAYDIVFIRDASCPMRIAEIHSYKNVETAQKAAHLHEIEPELRELFEKFRNLLAPESQQIDELIGEAVRVRDQ